MEQKLIWKPMPKILECNIFKLPAASQPTVDRIVKDYEIDFFIEGGGKIFVDDKVYDILPNTIMLRKPGQRCHSKGPYSCYVLTLNFSENINIAKNYYRQRNGEPQSLINDPCLDIMPVYLPVRSASMYHNIFSRLYNVQRIFTGEIEECNEKIITDLFLALLADAVYQNNQLFSGNNERELHPSLQKLCGWLHAHLKETISLQDMAKIVNLSPNYLHRLFLQQIHITPNRYLQQIRLEQACQLLINTNNSIEWISEQTGFNSVSYFTKNFRNEYGITPRDFRKCKGNNYL